MNEDKNIGKTFGIYTIVGLHTERDEYGHLLYVCNCNVCNTNVIRRLVDVKRYNDKCQHVRTTWKNKRIGYIFNSMVDRCYNLECKTYKWYGMKGVTVCDDWLNNPKLFEQWALEYGYADNLTIDRIDSSKDYSPENCRWIPLEENARRAGKVNWITINNETFTGRQWATKLELGLLTIDKYIRSHGFNRTKELIEAMLKEPPSTKHRKSHQTWFDVYGIQI